MGIEPTIFRFEVGRLIHWATRPMQEMKYYCALTLPGVGGGHYGPPTLKIAGIQNFEKQHGLIRPDFS